MAKRSSRKKVSKKSYYPVQRSVNMSMNPGSLSSEGRADHLLSATNHRLMRQSRVYTLKIDLSADAPAGTHYEIFALRNNWGNHKAYNFAYKTFLENSKEEMGVKSRWNDFRVMSGFGAQDLMVPQSTASVTAPDQSLGAGEYHYSEVSNADGVARNLIWEGSTGTSYNILSQYNLTDNIDADPTNASLQVPYDGLSDSLDDSQMEHLSDDGNLPPYSTSISFGGAFTRVGVLNNDAGTTNSKLSTGFFEAPCGFFFIVASQPRADHVGSAIFTLVAKAGDYKGVEAPSYLG